MFKAGVGLFRHTPWRKRRTLVEFGGVAATVLAVALIIILPAQRTLAEQPNIVEYAVPTPSSAPGSMVKGPDGNIWFTENQANHVGRIMTNGTIDEFTVPDPYSEPGGIMNGPDGKMWFVGVDPNTAHEALGSITTGGTATTYPTPTLSSNISNPAAGPDGNVWFTEFDNNKVGKITPGGTITEYAIPTPGSNPTDIHAGSDGNLWFTEQNASKVGRITPSGTITEFSLPSSATTMYGLTLGSDGNLWFAQQGPAAIDRVTITGTITQYSLPGAPTNTISMTNGPDGNIWFSDADNKEVGNITSNGTITEFSTGSISPSTIITGPDGNLWFMAPGSGSGKIGRVTPGGVVTIFDSPSATPSFVVVGSDGNLYFTDPLANKIGVLDLLPTITSTSTRPASYGTRIGITGNNFTNVTEADVGGTVVTQNPCPATFAGPCFTIDDDTTMRIQMPGTITASTNVQLTNSWGRGAGVSIAPLANDIAAAGTFTPHFVEPGNRGPVSSVKGPDGNMWFGENDPSAIAKIDSNGTITEYSLPNPSSSVGTITAGPDGNLWFVEGNTNSIGRITTGGSITEFSIPTAFSGPDDITSGPDGNLWFAEYSGNQVGRITPGGTITEYAASAPVSAITSGPDGNLWFTEQGGVIGKITTGGSIAATYTIPSANSISAITTGPDGNLWFTDSDANKIGSITTAGAVNEFPVPTASSYPLGITTGPDGNLWFTENSVNKIGSMTPAGIATEYAFSATDDYGMFIARQDSNLWFTTSDSIDELGFAAPPAGGGGGGGTGGSGGTTQPPAGSSPSGGGTAGSTGGTTTTSTPSGTTAETTPPPVAAPPATTDLTQQSGFSTSQGYSTDVVPGDQFTFTTPSASNGSQGQQYAITVGQITPASATLTIQSSNGSQAVELLPDTPKSVDVNADKISDVTFIATNLEYGRAKITFALYRAPAVPEVMSASPTAPRPSRFIDHIPRIVLVGFPYLLFVLLAAIMAVVLRSLVQEIVTTRRLRRLYQLQDAVAEQKDVFVQLASHYLRTPLTVITGGVELAAETTQPAQDKDIQALSKKASTLAAHIESLLSGIAAQSPQATVVSASFRRRDVWEVVRRPIFYVPAGVLVALVAVFYRLLLLADAARLARINLLIQSAIALLLIVGLYALLRGFQLHNQEQSALQNALEGQARLDERRNTFIADAANTLRGEVASFQGYITQLPETLAGKSVRDGVVRLQGVLDRFELTKELRLLPRPTDAEPVALASIWQRLQPTVDDAKAHGVEISLPTDQTVMLRNVPLFALALNSLLDNAIAYSKRGQQVVVTCQASAHTVTIDVKDEGKGMPSDQAATWFKPFSKREGGVSFDHEGMGMSLYLDRLIMTYLGGNISLESAPGQGTTAHLSLPRG